MTVVASQFVDKVSQEKEKKLFVIMQETFIQSMIDFRSNQLPFLNIKAHIQPYACKYNTYA